MIYAFVQITITDPAAFADYAQAAGPALEKYGAKPTAMSTEPVRLEGDAPAPTRAVILSFPDRAAAEGWINDPALAETHAKRRASGASEITLLC
jgi:uncharacterized protein (DUF1330 family)